VRYMLLIYLQEQALDETRKERQEAEEQAHDSKVKEAYQRIRGDEARAQDRERSRIADLLEKGAHKYDRGDYDAAVALALQLAPGFVMAHVLHACLRLCSRDVRRVQQVREWMANEGATLRTPDRRERTYLAAIAAVLADDYEGAKALLGTQLEREPGDALALQVARKLIGRLADDERLLALADTAARNMLPGSSLTLVVHPSHADALQARLTAMARHAGENGAPASVFELRADAACALDSCRIETEFGSVDASLNAQLDRLAQAWGVSERT